MTTPSILKRDAGRPPGLLPEDRTVATSRFTRGRSLVRYRSDLETAWFRGSLAAGEALPGRSARYGVPAAPGWRPFMGERMHLAEDSIPRVGRRTPQSGPLTQDFGLARVYTGRARGIGAGEERRGGGEARPPSRQPQSPGLILATPEERVVTDYDQRKGENEALFREVNERLKERMEDDSAWALPSEWICECADPECTERIEMSLLEYEDLRSAPTHFAVAPNREHVFTDVERIVEEREDYWVVEKLGDAAEIAEETDPR
jgi:hypothetical protein